MELSSKLGTVIAPKSMYDFLYICRTCNMESQVKCYQGCIKIYLEEHSEGSPHRINFSVRPSVWNTKTRRIFTQELKSGCPHGVFCLSSIPSEYLFLCARGKFGFSKKIHRNLLIVYVYCQPNSCTTHAEDEWAGGTFLRQRKKILQPMRSGSSEVVLCPILYCIDVFSTYLGEILDFVVVH